MAAYVGSRNHGPPGFREDVIATAERELGASFRFYFGHRWQHVLRDARVTLCPRGFGRTSYLVSEVSLPNKITSWVVPSLVALGRISTANKA